MAYQYNGSLPSETNNNGICWRQTSYGVSLAGSVASSHINIILRYRASSKQRNISVSAFIWRRQSIMAWHQREQRGVISSWPYNQRSIKNIGIVGKQAWRNSAAASASAMKSTLK